MTSESAKFTLLTGEALKASSTMFELLPFESIPGGALSYDRKASNGAATPVKSTLAEITGSAEIC